jgi:hypothetical protein
MFGLTDIFKEHGISQLISAYAEDLPLKPVMAELLAQVQLSITWHIEFETWDDRCNVQHELNKRYDWRDANGSSIIYKSQGNFEDFKEFVERESEDYVVELPTIRAIEQVCHASIMLGRLNYLNLY